MSEIDDYATLPSAMSLPLLEIHYKLHLAISLMLSCRIKKLKFRLACNISSLEPNNDLLLSFEDEGHKKAVFIRTIYKKGALTKQQIRYSIHSYPQIKEYCIFHKINSTELYIITDGKMGNLENIVMKVPENEYSGWLDLELGERQVFSKTSKNIIESEFDIFSDPYEIINNTYFITDVDFKTSLDNILHQQLVALEEGENWISRDQILKAMREFLEETWCVGERVCKYITDEFNISLEVARDSGLQILYRTNLIKYNKLKREVEINQEKKIDAFKNFEEKCCMRDVVIVITENCEKFDDINTVFHIGMMGEYLNFVNCYDRFFLEFDQFIYLHDKIKLAIANTSSKNIYIVIKFTNTTEEKELVNKKLDPFCKFPDVKIVFLCDNNSKNILLKNIDINRNYEILENVFNFTSEPSSLKKKSIAKITLSKDSKARHLKSARSHESGRYSPYCTRYRTASVSVHYI